MEVSPRQQKPIGRPRSCDCGTCHKCKHREYMRAYYQGAPMEQRRRWVKGRSAESVRRHERTRVRPVEHNQRENARLRARRAVKSGRLLKQPCERCGDPRVQAHHEDYSQALQVVWLCTVHHAARHRERVLEQAAF